MRPDNPGISLVIQKTPSSQKPKAILDRSQDLISHDLMPMRVNQPDAGKDADTGTSGVDGWVEIKPHGYVRLNLMNWKKDSFLTNAAGHFGCPCVED